MLTENIAASEQALKMRLNENKGYIQRANVPREDPWTQGILHNRWDSGIQPVDGMIK